MRNFKQGFTLLEILVSMTIMLVILGLSVPCCNFFIKKSKSQVMSSQLLRAINLTRSEAIMRGIPVTLCKSVDLETCSGSWQDGYIIFSEEKILFVFRNNANGILHWRGFPQNSEYLQFLPIGLSRSQNGTFWYCINGDNNPAWAIVISRSGRARLVYPDAANKIITDKGEVLSCGISGPREFHENPSRAQEKKLKIKKS